MRAMRGRRNMRLTHIFSMLMSIIWLVGRVPIFQKAYAQHAQRLEDDRWLHKQCSDPEFFTRMRQHADVCDTVCLFSVTCTGGRAC